MFGAARKSCQPSLNTACSTSTTEKGIEIDSARRDFFLARNSYCLLTLEAICINQTGLFRLANLSEGHLLDQNSLLVVIMEQTIVGVYQSH